MNDLVERYLNSIKRLLPGGQQEDIAAELSDEIQSRIEEKEAELGRKLKPQEVEAILKSIGSPAAVAARYGSNRYLIGPAVFPVYWFVLRTLLAIVLLAVAAGGVIRTAVSLAGGEPTSVAQSLAQMFGDLFSCAFFIVGFVTVVAAVIERVRPDLLEGDWLMEGLSRAPQGLAQAPADRVAYKLQRKAWRRAARGPAQLRVEGAFGLIINLVFFAWLAAVIAAPATVPTYLSPDYWLETTGLAFTPIWRELLFPVTLIGIAARVLMHLVMLAWPASQRRFAAAKLIHNAVNIGIAAVVLQSGPLFTTAPGLAPFPRLDEVVNAVNFALRLGFLIAGLVGVLSSLHQLWRLFGPRVRAPAAA